jgi:hypothetical protein
MYVYCGPCAARQQPIAEWAAELKAGDHVFVQPYAAWRGLSHSKCLIVDRVDDVLTVQIVGLPQSRLDVHVNHCGPRNLTPLRMVGAR